MSFPFSTHRSSFSIGCKARLVMLNSLSFSLSVNLLSVLSLKILESPLGCKEIKPVNPKGNQSWILIGGNDAEAEAPILWPPDVKSWLIGKYPHAVKDWRQEEKGMRGQMVEWHHQLNGHEFEEAPGDGEGQGSLVCCSPLGCKSWTQLSDWTTNLLIFPLILNESLAEYSWL